MKKPEPVRNVQGEKPFDVKILVGDPPVDIVETGAVQKIDISIDRDGAAAAITVDLNRQNIDIQCLAKLAQPREEKA